MFGKTYIKRATSFDDMTHTSQSLSEVGQKKKKKTPQNLMERLL